MKRELENLFNQIKEEFIGPQVDNSTQFRCKVISNDNSVEIERRGNEVVVRTNDGVEEKEGIAKCHTEDAFDLEKGLEIAKMRLDDKNYATEENFKPHLKFVDETLFGYEVEDPEGTMGDLTNLVDYLGNQLHIGDLVEVYNVTNPKSYEERKVYPSVEYVMGYKGRQFVASYANSTQLKDYIIRLVKPYNKVENGEVHGILRAVTKDTKKVEESKTPVSVYNKEEVTARKCAAETIKDCLSTVKEKIKTVADNIIPSISDTREIEEQERKERITELKRQVMVNKRLIDNYSTLAEKLNDGTIIGEEYSKYYEDLAKQVIEQTKEVIKELNKLKYVQF